MIWQARHEEIAGDQNQLPECHRLILDDQHLALSARKQSPISGGFARKIYRLSRIEIWSGSKKESFFKSCQMP
jgi:hypothetical protein